MVRIRKFCRRAMVLYLLAAIGWVGAWPAHALEVDAARIHVEATIEQILQLIRANQPRAETAKVLRKIFEERTALTQLAKFSSGRHWGQMSAQERARFTETFSNYVAFVYAGYFSKFEGDIEDLRAVVNILGAEDVGQKGVLVHTEIRPVHQLGISIDWLVSDRSGKIAISDLRVEGISLAVTQREIISAMLDAKQGDVNGMIADVRQRAKAGP
jgi:phospholipid transport system substrate-binding protein